MDARYLAPPTLDAYRQLNLHPAAVVHDPHLSVFLKPEMISIGAHSRIDGLVKIEGGLGVTIGEHVHVASFSHINGGGGTVILEDHSVCSSGARIIGGYPDPGYVHVSAAEPPELCHVIRRVTRICAYAVVFSNAIILPGIRIGERCLIGAGAVVTKDVPDGEIWAGNPARKIGVRTIAERDSTSFYSKLACHG
jgi:acetyltransferase-like isoleucine patch superfamily enzyme